jgi:hypothetical protein
VKNVSGDLGADGKCICCRGKQRLVTDMWNKETMAMWEPCPFCCAEEATAFYNDTTTEVLRQGWYSKGGKHLWYVLNAEAMAAT